MDIIMKERFPKVFIDQDLQCTVLHCIVLHCAVLYCIALCHVVLY